MIGKNKFFQNLQQIVFYLLVFLIPTQLGYHIWLNSSYVFGLKIDYLALTIYLTDILIWLYILIFLIKNKFKEKIFKNKKNIVIYLFIFLFVLANIFYSYNREIAIIKWLKILELVIFSFFVSKDVYIQKSKLLRTFSISLIFFCLIGLVQFIRGSTSNGLFYFLGERNFDITTPGISLVFVFNKVFLRPYSTFSHPNSFAGYILIMLIYIYFWKDLLKKDKLVRGVSIIIGLLLLLISSSKAVFISLFAVILLYVFKVSSKNVIKILIGIFIISLLLPIFSSYVLANKLIFTQTINDRLVLSEIAGKIISQKPLFGVGLNNFISYIPLVNPTRISFWFLQPVHNIFLLLLVETGFLGISIVYVLFTRGLSGLIKTKNSKYLLVLVAIFITGFFDHYWITLQQNIVLLFLILGLYSNPQIK